jgi:hypothetical protein
MTKYFRFAAVWLLRKIAGKDERILIYKAELLGEGTRIYVEVRGVPFLYKSEDIGDAVEKTRKEVADALHTDPIIRPARKSDNYKNINDLQEYWTLVFQESLPKQGRFL